MAQDTGRAGKAEISQIGLDKGYRILSMAGHVYLIGSKDFHWYKIGKSSNATIRVSELGILLPFKIEVIAVWKSVNHHELEQNLHAMFEGNKINGEWFSFTDLELPTVISKIDELRLTVSKVDGFAQFSNIEKNVLPKKPYRAEERLANKMAHSEQQLLKRIGKLTAQNRELERQLQKFLASGSPVSGPALDQ